MGGLCISCCLFLPASLFVVFKFHCRCFSFLCIFKKGTMFYLDSELERPTDSQKNCIPLRQGWLEIGPRAAEAKKEKSWHLEDKVPLIRITIFVMFSLSPPSPATFNAWSHLLCQDIKRDILLLAHLIRWFHSPLFSGIRLADGKIRQRTFNLLTDRRQKEREREWKMSQGHDTSVSPLTSFSWVSPYSFQKLPN